MSSKVQKSILPWILFSPGTPIPPAVSFSSVLWHQNKVDLDASSRKRFRKPSSSFLGECWNNYSLRTTSGPFWGGHSGIQRIKNIQEKRLSRLTFKTAQCIRLNLSNPSVTLKIDENFTFKDNDLKVTDTDRFWLDMPTLHDGVA